MENYLFLGAPILKHITVCFHNTVMHPINHISKSSGLAQTILVLSKHSERKKEEKEDRRTGGKTIGMDRDSLKKLN